jgi:hypothetical protein
MPVRTAYVGLQAAQDILTAANFSRLPGGWIGWEEVYADQTGITTDTALTGLSVTVTVNTNRRLKVSAQMIVEATVATDRIAGYIKQDGVVIANFIDDGDALATGGMMYSGWTVTAPAAGSHTFALSIARTTGTGTIGMLATLTNPASLLVEDIGPAS